MTLINKVIPGLYNGVSQQPAGVRLDTQCEEQKNCFPLLAEGLTKRPPAEHIAKLNLTNNFSNVFIHTVNRDVSERYVMIFTGDSTEPIEIFTIDGDKCTVQYGTLDGDLNYTEDTTVKTYFTESSNPKDSFSALTIADYTIVANKNKEIQYDSTVAGGTIKGSKQVFVDLPDSVTEGDVYEIKGDGADNFSQYYVKWDGAVWVECVKPGLNTTFDGSTMPHRIVRTATNEFTVAPIIWDARVVGDDIITPPPSLLEKKINDVAMFKDRLVLLAGENIVMSRSGDFFNLWPKTCLDVLDDGPIDVAVSSEKVSILNYCIAFQETLLLFSDQQQFALQSGSNALTAQTVSADVTTRFEATGRCKPVGSGPNVYFVVPKSDNSAIREYYVQPETLVNDAADITAHIPTYLPSGVIKMTASSSMETIVVLSEETVDTLYVYRYYWQGEEKVQSAWGKWTFDGSLKDVEFIGDTLYVVIERDENEVCIEAITLQTTDTGNVDFRIHLDRLTEITGVYDEPTNTTTWTLPYSVSTDTPVVSIKNTNGEQIINTERPTLTTVTKIGDYSGSSCCLGINYEMRYEFTKWVPKTSEDNVDLLRGRLQVRTLTVGYVDTGYFKLEVTPKGRSTHTREWTGVIIGQSSFGSPYISDGKYRFAILGNARKTKVELVNDSYLPSSFQNASWEGSFNTRSRNIG